MPIAKRARWTEEEVISLPAGEHDYFERKSGALLSDPRFGAKLAKALSAFSNSGGGHLLLGVQDDGTIDGLDPMHQGRTATREWLEQAIPDLLDYPLQDFRVHEVERAPAGSTIPSGKTVIVIDVGDSERAPHQSKQDWRYYVRVGGRSEPAAHWMIEDIRNRLRHPNVMVRDMEILSVNALAGFTLQDRTPRGQLDVSLRVQLANTGHVKAANCCVRLTAGQEGTFAPDRDFLESVHARPVGEWRGAFWEMQHPIYPEMETDFRCRYILFAQVSEPVPGLKRFVISGTSKGVGEIVISSVVFADSAPPRLDQKSLEEMGFSGKAGHLFVAR